ncbi:SMC-Scp complex subunit ScpB [Rhizobium sp. FY34]|uniref:SMC-Scp complex subunit ScpB n=1 Tax=Rhizobium sp. FY34 TaxID=2562309 RepID=UPI0010BFE950|nr:SMC-Scp complex subunit ScpB [Rhizobium sp. FY34]
MARSPKQPPVIDRNLDALPASARWREWMNRVEAVVFAAREPVSRDILSSVIGHDCNLDLIISDIQAELATKPFELALVGGGYQFRTKPAYADVIKASGAPVDLPPGLSQHEAMVLMVIGYFQPVTRSEISRIFGREVSRDTIGSIKRGGFISFGPRSPSPGAPYTYITTSAFLTAFGFATLRDLPDLEMLEDAGLLSRHHIQKDVLSSLLGDEDVETE